MATILQWPYTCNPFQPVGVLLFGRTECANRFLPKGGELFQGYHTFLAADVTMVRAIQSLSRGRLCDSRFERALARILGKAHGKRAQRATTGRGSGVAIAKEMVE
jgi:hypothetical protein